MGKSTPKNMTNKAADRITKTAIDKPNSKTAKDKFDDRTKIAVEKNTKAN